MPINLSCISKNCKKENKSLTKKKECLNSKCAKERKEFEDKQLQLLISKPTSQNQKLLKNFNYGVEGKKKYECMVSKCLLEANDYLSLRKDRYKQNCKEGDKKSCKIAKAADKLLNKKPILAKDYIAFSKIEVKNIKKANKQK